jgi:hypothetical protein
MSETLHQNGLTQHQVTNLIVDLVSSWFQSFCNVLFLYFNLLIGRQLSIWNCCNPFFSLLYNCQLLCFWWLALSTAVEVFQRPFFPDIAPSSMRTTKSLCLINYMPYPWVASIFFKFLKLIFLLSPLEKLHHSLFCPSYFKHSSPTPRFTQFTTISSFFPRVHVSGP